MADLDEGVSSDFWAGYFQNTSGVKNSPSLRELNTEEVIRLMPLIIYLMLVTAVGVLGNGLVCHVYRTRYKQSNSQCFILVLSAIDLFSCLLVVPFEITTILYQFTFQHIWVCKLSRFLNSWPTVASGFMLVSIAVDRYRKVCVPFGRQISFKMTKIMCLSSLLLGLFFSWPALVLYGRKTFVLRKYGYNATECSTDDSQRSSVLPFINNVTFGFLFLAGTLILTVFYSLIAQQIRRHAKEARLQGTSSALNLQRIGGPNRDDAHDKNHSGSFQEESSICEAETHKLQTDSKLKIGFSDKASKGDDSEVFEDATGSGTTSSVDRPMRAISFENTNDNCETESLTGRNMNRSISHESVGKKQIRGILKKISTGSRLVSIGAISHTHSGSSRAEPGTRINRKRQKRAKQMTFLMFLISLAYILSYLPHVLLMLLRAVKGDFVDSMTDSGRATYKFFLRSYALNCIVNPFIYGACDARFRRACKTVFRAMCGFSRRDRRR